MKSIAIIPARSGSKGLEDKNIREMCGKPLMAYSIEAARGSKKFSEIMVSTDSKKYAEISEKYGASVPFLRSAEMSGDRVSSWDVVREILERYRDIGEEFDIVCLLQPTSPLRTRKDIIDAFLLFEEKKADSVIGVCEVEHSPLWTNVIGDDLKLDGFLNNNAKDVPRQMLEQYYRINGAMYIVKSETIIKKQDIYSNSYAYIMPRERSIDIDEELDFVMAESIMKYYGGN